MGGLITLIPALLPGLMEVLKRFIPDPKAQAEAAQALATKLAESDKAIYESMRDVMVADAQSEGFLTRSARPITVYWSLGLISYLVIVCPAFGLTDLTLAAIKGVPGELWMLLTAGVGAYPVLKTIEAAMKRNK